MPRSSFLAVSMSVRASHVGAVSLKVAEDEPPPPPFFLVTWRGRERWDESPYETRRHNEEGGAAREVVD